MVPSEPSSKLAGAAGLGPSVLPLNPPMAKQMINIDGWKKYTVHRIINQNYKNASPNPNMLWMMLWRCFLPAGAAAGVAAGAARGAEDDKLTGAIISF